MLKSKCKFIIENYFIVLCINAIAILLFNIGYTISIIFPLCVLLYAIKSLKVSKTNIYDTLIAILFFWMIVTWIFNSYNHKLILILRCILCQIAFMTAYYIGRNDTNNITNKFNGKTFNNLVIFIVYSMKLPSSAVIIIG